MATAPLLLFLRCMSLFRWNLLRQLILCALIPLICFSRLRSLAPGNLPFISCFNLWTLLIPLSSILPGMLAFYLLCLQWCLLPCRFGNNLSPFFTVSPIFSILNLTLLLFLRLCQLNGSPSSSLMLQWCHFVPVSFYFFGELFVITSICSSHFCTCWFLVRNESA